MCQTAYSYNSITSGTGLKYVLVSMGQQCDIVIAPSERQAFREDYWDHFVMQHTSKSRSWEWPEEFEWGQRHKADWIQNVARRVIKTWEVYYEDVINFREEITRQTLNFKHAPLQLCILLSRHNRPFSQWTTYWLEVTFDCLQRRLFIDTAKRMLA